MSDSNGLSAIVETITPQIAHELLATKERPDRGVSVPHVQQLANDMRRGYWTVNGESIKITKVGEVIDGQHRLKACILAERPFDSLIVRGLPDDDAVQYTTDSGRRRSIADALRIRGEKYSNEVAGVAVMQWRFLEGKMALTFAPSVPVALKLVGRFGGEEDGPGFRHSIREISHLRHSSRGYAMSPVLSAWGHFVFGEVDRRTNGNDGLNNQFWDGLWRGVELIDGDPRLLLRNRLLEHYQSVKQSNKLGISEMRALVIKAWNAFSNGQTVRNLRWRQVGSGREAFPLINGQDKLEDWFRVRL